MSKVISIFALALFVLSISAFAQDDPPTAAVSLERYLASELKVSVLLPKMPTKIQNLDPCKELAKDSYYAYAEQVVYEFTVVYRKRVTARCPTTSTFGDDTLASRLTELRNPKLPLGAPAAATPPAVNESPAQVAGISSYKFESGLNTRWVIPDMSKNRWVELSVSHRPDIKPDIEQFVGSLSLGSSDGKDLGEGAVATVGDINVKTDVFSDSRSKDPGATPFYVISKPRASYTDEARRKKTKGSVTLKVPLLANGAVGKIEAVRSLENGLTEQAIAAAKKITFIPKTVNGTPVSSVVTFEYSFSIY